MPVLTSLGSNPRPYIIPLSPSIGRHNEPCEWMAMATGSDSGI